MMNRHCRICVLRKSWGRKIFKKIENNKNPIHVESLWNFRFGIKNKTKQPNTFWESEQDKSHPSYQKQMGMRLLNRKFKSRKQWNITSNLEEKWFSMKAQNSVKH